MACVYGAKGCGLIAYGYICIQIRNWGSVVAARVFEVLPVADSPLRRLLSLFFEQREACLKLVRTGIKGFPLLGVRDLRVYLGRK